MTHSRCAIALEVFKGNDNIKTQHETIYQDNFLTSNRTFLKFMKLSFYETKHQTWFANCRLS